MLIAIEGIDGSGKKTQADLLVQRLIKEGKRARKISFPMYDRPGCMMVKAYLNGEFGQDANAISPYVASMFFAEDRYLSMSEWIEDALDKNTFLVCDRYVGSNAIHQAAKIDDPLRQQNFFWWLKDLEYDRLRIPKEDLCIFLAAPASVAEKLMHRRTEYKSGTATDIHETNSEFQKKSYETGMKASEIFRWDEIQCAENDEMCPSNVIAERIYAIVKERFSL